MKVIESDHVLITFAYWVLRRVCFFVIRPLLIRKVVGLSNIPKKGAAIIAFNHQSFFDFICFASVSPRNVHFLAAEKFFDGKILKFIMMLTGQIKVDRKSE